MTIEEFKNILKDEKMSSKKTNIRIIDDKVNPGRLTIAQVHKEVVELKEIVLLFIKEQRKFNAKQEKFNAKQEKFNQYVLDVFKRNNLK